MSWSRTDSAASGNRRARYALRRLKSYLRGRRSESTHASCCIRFAGVQDLAVDVLAIEAGDRRECLIAIGEIEKTVTLGSAALDVSRNADRISVPEWQSERVKLLVADVAGDISYIDFHQERPFPFLFVVVIGRRSSLAESAMDRGDSAESDNRKVPSAFRRLKSGCAEENRSPREWRPS